MPLTSAQKSKLYRERKKKRLGEEYVKAESAKRRERRSKRKQPVSKKIPITDADKTLKQYCDNADRVYKGLTNKKINDIDDFKLFEDTERALNYILTSEWSDNTKKSYLVSLAMVLKILKDKETSKIYLDASVKLGEKINNKIDENKLTDKEKMNWIDQKSLSKVYKSIVDPQAKALIGLYTLIPPRRRGLAVYLTLTTAKELKKNKENNKNWLVVNKSNLPNRIVMRKYKTHKTYGEYVIKLTGRALKPLRDILKVHIIANEINHNDPVFPTPSGLYHQPANMSNTLTTIFRNSIGKELTFNLLRHIKITDFLSMPRSIKCKKTLAKQMGHSVNIQAKYQRIVVGT